MAKRGKWFGAVKRVFGPESKEKKGQKKNKSKKKWGFGCSHFDPDSSENSTHYITVPASPPKELKLTKAENDESKHAYSVALASAVAAEAAKVAAEAAAEVFRLTNSTRFSGRSKEDAAAIKIQTAFRGYLARRALRALRGLVRLKSLTSSSAVQRQSSATLRSMQMLARVQAQIRSRRIRMSEENMALQRQLQLNHQRELEKLKMAEEWDDSLQSKEQIEAHLQNKQDAAVRRERALAYAFSHQRKSSSRSPNPTFMDPNNPQWGWSWTERWMASRPWESPNPNTSSHKNHNNARTSVKKYWTPPSKALSIAGMKIKSASPGSRCDPREDDSNSVFSVKSERPRRHSMGSSVRDEESLTSNTASVRSYMAATESGKAKPRYKSSLSKEIDAFSEAGSVSSARKRLSFPIASNGGKR